MKERRKLFKLRRIVLILLYSVSSPIGIGIGWIMWLHCSALLVVITTAISGGAFLYGGATEVVREDFEGGKNWKKGLYFILGVVLTLGMQGILTNGSHSH